ncbi:MAG: transporter substrate-binding domain-containing protein [Treponema sp.]|nr:transporter substrate-binding domain-containing protein [Treponema sp.]
MKINQFTVLFLFIVFIIGITACSTESDKPLFKSFRDVPGVTAREIEAVEALQKKYEYFSYGMILSTEAFVMEDGRTGGYAALFCEWLTQLFNIPFKLEIMETNEILEKMETGEVDFSGNLMPTDERRQRYYMTDTIAERQFILVRLAGSPSLDQILLERPIRYAFPVNTPVEETIAMVTEPDSYEPVWVFSIMDAYDILNKGEADAYITSSITEAVFINYDNIVTQDFFPLCFNPTTMAASGTREDLEPIISIVTKAQRSGAMSLMLSLYNQGYQDYRRYKMFESLNEKERAFLLNNPTIPIAAFNTNYPLSFYNTYVNEWQGIYFDLLNEITSLTGLAFKIVHDEKADWHDIKEMLLNREALLIPELGYTKEYGEHFIWSGTVILDDNYALVSRSEFRDITINEILHVKTGVAGDETFTSLFRQWFPNHRDIVEYGSIDLALDALQRGEVDMVMTTQRRLMNLTHFREEVGYKANYIFNQSMETRFAANKEEEILLSIIDKAFILTNINAITDSWMRKTYDYRVKIAEAQRPLLLGAITLSFVVIILILVLFFRYL